MRPTTIYLDHMASTPLDPRVKAVVLEAMDEEFANPHAQDHALGWRAAERLELARRVAAEAVGAASDELIFTSGATEADNLGVLGAALAAPRSRRRILVGALEHKAVLESARAAERFGFRVELVRATVGGVIDLGDLAERLGPDVAVVSIGAVNNEIGTHQPILEAARLAAAVGAFVHTDAAQAPAAMAVDVLSWGVDAASFSGHKCYGPKGVGALYLSSAAPWRPQPLTFGGGQEGGLRPGTVAVPLCAGFAEALRLTVDLGASERARIRLLRDRLAVELRTVRRDILETCADTSRHPGLLHVRFPGIEAAELLQALQPDLAASAGSACTSGIVTASHVLLAIGMGPGEAAECVRFSLGRFTSEAEIVRAGELVARASISAALRAE